VKGHDFQRGAIAGFAVIAIIVLGFLAGGANLAQPGLAAGSCYVFSMLGGVYTFFLVSAIFRVQEREAVRKEAAPPPPTPPQPQGVNLEAFERLAAQVKVLENKIAALSFLGGRFGRPRAPSSPESPK
jgi:hypothetical protein